MSKLTYNVYRNGSKIAENISESNFTDTGLDYETTYEYQVSAVNEVGESKLSKAVLATTKPKPVVNVTGVTLSPKTVEFDAGMTGGTNATATIQPSNATDKTLSFNVEPKVSGLSVNNSGRIDWDESVPAGEYVVTVTTQDGGHTDTLSLTLNEPVITVTSVEISPESVTGVEGGASSRQLNSTVLPENATNKNVTYTVNPSAVGLSISTSGLLAWTADTPSGTYTITVATVDGNKTATSTLVLNEPEPEITTGTKTENINVIEYSTIRNETDDLPLGQEEIAQQGVNGYTTVTYEITYADGIEIDREEVDRKVVDPIDEIINVGTYKEPEITKKTETETVDIVGYDTVRNETNDLPLGEEEVVQQGVDGYTVVTYEITYADDVEVSREEINREVINPINEIINVGIYEEPEPEPEPTEPEPEIED